MSTENMQSVTTSPAVSKQPAFYDLFRRLLAWRNAANYVMPMEQRRKLPADALIHVPTAEKAQVLP